MFRGPFIILLIVAALIWYQRKTQKKIEKPNRTGEMKTTPMEFRMWMTKGLA